MKNKKCPKCKIEKDLSEFYKCKSRYDGVQSICKICGIIQMSKHRAKTKLIRSLKSKKYYLKNRKKILNRCKNYQRINKEKRSIYYKNYSLKNKEKLKNYYIKNKNHITKIQIKRQKFRLKNDINYKIKIGLKVRFKSALKNNIKRGHTLELLGCSIEFFRKNLESQFTEGMNWNNYGRGGWVIDHIRPCSSFDLSKKSEQMLCEHYTNKQPLWEVDNLKKSNNF
jgi:hypothetical protein